MSHVGRQNFTLSKLLSVSDKGKIDLAESAFRFASDAYKINLEASIRVYECFYARKRCIGLITSSLLNWPSSSNHRNQLKQIWNPKQIAFSNKTIKFS